MQKTKKKWTNDAGSLSVIPRNINYFELLEVPQSYDLNPKLLREKYFILQNSMHPDRHQHNAALLELAIANSSLVNQAYHTLSDNFLRAQYILELHGLTLHEAQLTMEFMLQMLQLREQLGENKQTHFALKQLQEEEQKSYEALRILLERENWQEALMMLAQINTIRAVVAQGDDS